MNIPNNNFMFYTFLISMKMYRRMDFILYYIVNQKNLGKFNKIHINTINIPTGQWLLI